MLFKTKEKVRNNLLILNKENSWTIEKELLTTLIMAKIAIENLKKVLIKNKILTR